MADLSEHFNSFVKRDYWTQKVASAPYFSLNNKRNSPRRKHPKRALRMPYNKNKIINASHVTMKNFGSNFSSQHIQNLISWVKYWHKWGQIGSRNTYYGPYQAFSFRFLSFLIKTIPKPNQNNSIPPAMNKNGNTIWVSSMGSIR